MAEDQIALANRLWATVDERGVHLRRDIAGNTQEIVALITWPVLDVLRTKRPPPFLHLIAGADRVNSS